MTLFHDDTAPRKRPSKRRENDRYLTPPMATQALMQEFPGISGQLLLDPCCGDGRMARQLQTRFLRHLTNDVCDADGRDATLPRTWEQWAQWRRSVTTAWVVTNPPFAWASAIVAQAIEAGFHAAFLLRITWLEPTKDRQWIARRPPTAMLVLPRVDFIGDGGSDGATCAWMIWGPVTPGIRVVRAQDIGQMELVR